MKKISSNKIKLFLVSRLKTYNFVINSRLMYNTNKICHSIHFGKRISYFDFDKEANRETNFVKYIDGNTLNEVCDQIYKNFKSFDEIIFFMEYFLSEVYNKCNEYFWSTVKNRNNINKEKLSMLFENTFKICMREYFKENES